jgi:hypothetical protein
MIWRRENSLVTAPFSTCRCNRREQRSRTEIDANDSLVLINAVAEKSNRMTGENRRRTSYHGRARDGLETAGPVCATG